MMTLNQRLDLVEKKLLMPEFRTGRGTASEINFWIFDYDAKDELAVRSHVRYLENHINHMSHDVRMVVFDLYELILEALKDKGYLEKVLEMEQKKGSESILNPIKKTLRLTLQEDLIIAKITKDLVPGRDIVCLTGIGKAWPIIRSHTILNNLHHRMSHIPMVMFFPGEYSDTLRLFHEITDDNYYRAFRLIER